MPDLVTGTRKTESKNIIDHHYGTRHNNKSHGVPKVNKRRGRDIRLYLGLHMNSKVPSDKKKINVLYRSCRKKKKIVK